MRNLIVTLCTGNVCRSPMAEKLLQHAIDVEPPLAGLSVVSAGVAAGYGEPASRNAIDALKKVDLDLSRHKSQPLRQDLVDRAFAVFGMTESHIDILERYHDTAGARIHLFREFLAEEEDRIIPDPFGLDYDAYVECRDSMIEAIPSVIAYLKREYKAAD